jgi:hypothetical protein
MKKILILASNPRKDLNLDREIRDLRDVVESSRNREGFDVEDALAVRVGDLQDLLLEHSPYIVHFCGHGGGRSGLVLESKDGGEQWVRTDALRGLFRLFSKKVKCVVLNACYSEEQADEIVNHIDYVIGMDQEIRDDAAIAFSKGFYRALGYDCTIEEAYAFGCNAIQLEISSSANVRSAIAEPSRKAEVLRAATTTAIPEHLKPVLRKRQGLVTGESQGTHRSTLAPATKEKIQQSIVNEILADEMIVNEMIESAPNTVVQSATGSQPVHHPVADLTTPRSLQSSPSSGDRTPNSEPVQRSQSLITPPTPSTQPNRRNLIPLVVTSSLVGGLVLAATLLHYLKPESTQSVESTQTTQGTEQSQSGSTTTQPEIVKPPTPSDEVQSRALKVDETIKASEALESEGKFSEAITILKKDATLRTDPKIEEHLKGLEDRGLKLAQDDHDRGDLNAALDKAKAILGGSNDQGANALIESVKSDQELSGKIKDAIGQKNGKLADELLSRVKSPKLKQDFTKEIAGLASPNAPEVPAIPEPSEPSDPSDPSNPSNPSDPSDPSDPSEKNVYPVVPYVDPGTLPKSE